VAKGYIKLHRGITEHWLCDDKPFDMFHAWVDLILQANWKTSQRVFNGQIITQERGQVICSIGGLAERWGWSKGKVRRFIAALEKDKMVHTDGSTHGTTLTIEKYAFFQDSRHTDGSTDGTADGSTDGTQQKKNKEELRNARARGSSEDPDAALEEVEAEGMPDWFKEQVEGMFGKM